MRRLAYVFLACLAISACATTTRYGHSYSIHTGQIYKSSEGVDLVMDLYTPHVKGPKPAVIVVHGGSWASRSGDMSFVCANLAQAGFVAANITYRLGDKGRYPNAVNDVRDAIQWMRDHAVQLEMDPDKIGGWGYSAGAQLVLLAGLDPKSGIKAIVSGGTPADFPAWPKSPLITKFLGKTLEQDRPLWEEASPVNRVQIGSPPVFLYHGQEDTLVEVEQMYKMRDALAAKNIHAETHAVSYAGHIMVYLFSQESIDLGIRFLKQTMNI